MAPKTARVYTLDDLKEKSQKALADPKLVEIIKSAPLNKDGKANCTWAYKEAEKYVHEQTKDLQKTKELAVATRFLAMLRRDYSDEFEKLIMVENGHESAPLKIFSDILFSLPWESYLISERRTNGDYQEDYIKFSDDGPTNQSVGRRVARSLCLKIIHALIDTSNPHPDKDLLNDLIQLLEEKFGLKVKVCGNCKRYVQKTHYAYLNDREGMCYYNFPNGYPTNIVSYSDLCAVGWTPKEPLKKPSSA